MQRNTEAILEAYVGSTPLSEVFFSTQYQYTKKPGAKSNKLKGVL